MQTLQTELQSNRKLEEQENSEPQVNDVEMLRAKKIKYSTLKWEDVAGLF